MKLLVEWEGNSKVIDSDRPFTLGRDVSADIKINATKVSRIHARIDFSENEWKITDLNSSNGIYFKKKPIIAQVIDGPMKFNLGGLDGIEVFLSPISSQTTSTTVKKAETNSTQLLNRSEFSSESETPETQAGRIRLQNRVRIGRDPNNDWVIDSLSVSRFHAELIQNSAGEFEVVDLKSANGTFINLELTRRAIVHAGDLITFGAVTRRFTQSGLEPVEGLTGSTLEVIDSSFSVKTKKLLQEINLTLEPRTLTAIIGPSGAGKSTLLNLLSGRIRPSQGNVLINGLDIETHHKLLNQKIGYVPQSDILHAQLSTEQALSFGAELRLSSDISKAERKEKVNEILEKLELAERKHLPIKKLSGGQRKRASIGLELITSPEILFLDEPTSGLDPGLDAHVMETLRKLADEGQTVVLVTHSVDNLNFCDNVILMASGGKIAYSGPASTVFAVLQKKNWAEVFRFLASSDALLLAQRNQSSLISVGSNLTAEVRNNRSFFKQAMTLGKRYLKVISTDRYYTSLLLAIPVLTGILCYLSGNKQGFGRGHLTKYGFYYNSGAQGTILILILGSVFIGLSTAIQEIVKESTLRKREQSAGVRATSYIFSKVVVLGVITSLQELVFTSIVLFKRPMQPHGLLIANSRIELTVLCILLTLTALAVGLFISSLLTSQEQAMPVLVGITMLEVILSGALPITTGPVLAFISKLIPSYWATNAISASTNLVKTALVSDAHLKAIWAFKLSTIETAMSIMGISCLVFIGLAGLRVQRDRR